VIEAYIGTADDDDDDGVQTTPVTLDKTRKEDR
jgi:hypothetical protein